MQESTTAILLIAAFILISALLFHPSSAQAHGDLHEQIAAMSKEIEKDPQNTELYLKRGELHRFHQDWNAALADLEHALQLDPELDAVYLYRGELWYDKGSPELARKDLDRFLGDHPDHERALIVRARALVALNHLSDAAKDYSHALTLHPNPDIYVERAKALASGTKEHQEEALKGLDEGIEKLGPLVTLELPAIDLELRQKRYDAALHRLDRVSAQSERKESWLARQGDILLEAGRIHEAEKAYSDAMSALQILPEARRNTRSVQELEHHIQEALKRISEF